MTSEASRKEVGIEALERYLLSLLAPALDFCSSLYLTFHHQYFSSNDPMRPLMTAAL